MHIYLNEKVQFLRNYLRIKTGYKDVCIKFSLYGFLAG